MEELLTSSVEAAVLQSFPEVRAADVELTWDPAWSEARMSDAARAQLGWTSR
jgi:metal-sulfur cluster biosynthetic enzyme